MNRLVGFGSIVVAALFCISVDCLADDAPASAPATRKKEVFVRVEQEMQAISDSGGSVDLAGLSIRYVRDKDGIFGIGYFDYAAKRLYLWNGVKLKEDDVPWEKSPFRRVADVIDLATAKEMTLVKVDPPIQFARLPEDKLAPGFLDFDNRYFFQLKGVEIAASSLRPDEKMKHQIISPLIRYKVVTIIVPEHRSKELQKITEEMHHAPSK